MSLLTVSNVHKHFKNGPHVTRAVDGVSFTIKEGEVLGIIGESGSGKSTVARIAVGLLQPDAGTVIFDGRDVSTMGPRERRALRTSIGIVFQDPFGSLDPRRTALESVLEPLEVKHPGRAARKTREAAAREALNRVGIGPELQERYPSRLSGGEQQRVGIARAIVTRPRLVLLDEPTSALDRSIRGDILDLLSSIQRDDNLTYCLISHDVETVARLAHRVLVMYRGQVVESGPTDQILGAPRHPYTQLLLSARLPLDPDAELPPLPTPARPPRGHSECQFFPRCHRATEDCTAGPIPTIDIAPDHRVTCRRLASAESR
ncbi:MAG: peptide ABC transporter ATP-binding protein [Actinobacteria bacterium]|nr:MAG: peptide ABC transporter ATP-binding protein [Actinomycetota bacterium]